MTIKYHPEDKKNPRMTGPDKLVQKTAARAIFNTALYTNNAQMLESAKTKIMAINDQDFTLEMMMKAATVAMTRSNVPKAQALANDNKPV